MFKKPLIVPIGEQMFAGCVPEPIDPCSPCTPCHPDSGGDCSPCTPCHPDSGGACSPCSPCHPDSGTGCFITTACVQAKGLNDDAYELNILRTFRDQYIKNLPEGNQVISEYYRVAPQIVEAINETHSVNEIYSMLYDTLVARSLQLIQLGKKHEAYLNYRVIVDELKRKYL